MKNNVQHKQTHIQNTRKTKYKKNANGKSYQKHHLSCCKYNSSICEHNKNHKIPYFP